MLPGGKLTVSRMLPEPMALPVAPPENVAVQVTPVSDVGNVSVTVAPFAGWESGALETTIVYVIVVPGRTLVLPSVLVTARSAVIAARPIWPALDSVNHKLPSGPEAMPTRPAAAVRPVAISVMTPATVIRPS